MGRDAEAPVDPNIDAPPRPANAANQNNERASLNPMDRFKKENKYELLKLGFFAAAILICLFALPQENKGCSFGSTRFNMIFFYFVVITETFMRILWQFLFVTNDENLMSSRNFILKAICGILYAAWTIYVLKTYDSFTPHCYDPYPSYSLAVFAIIICFILPRAFIVVCVTTMVVIFSPCLIWMYCKQR